MCRFLQNSGEPSVTKSMPLAWMQLPVHCNLSTPHRVSISKANRNPIIHSDDSLSQLRFGNVAILAESQERNFSRRASAYFT